MFLTRMALDVSRPDTQALLQEPGRMQREIRAAFAGGNIQPLFRTDMISSRLWLVVLSRLRPSLYAAHEHYGYPGVFPSWETFDYDETLEEAEAGTNWNFELEASPVGVSPEADPAWLEPYRLHQWLTRQAEHCGFRVKEDAVTRGDWVSVGDAYLLGNMIREMMMQSGFRLVRFRRHRQRPGKRRRSDDHRPQSHLLGRLTQSRGLTQ